MKLSFSASVLPAGDGITKVTALAWSPNTRRLAVVTTDRIILLFDEQGTRRDRIPTKPADTQGARNYQVRGIAFSPDSTKIAVAQSDKIVFVYKIGLEWGDKKSICNKFHQQAEVTTVVWPTQRPTATIFGLSDGRVRLGNLKTNKSGSLYNAESYVVSLCAKQDGSGFLSGHMDGSIYLYQYHSNDDGATHTKVATHPCPPYALGSGESIVAAGYDRKVMFYTEQGLVSSQFDYAKSDPAGKEFTVAAVNATSTCAVVGSFNSLRVFSYNVQRGGQWEEADELKIPSLYTVTALHWRPDGGGLAVGSLCGSISLFESHHRRVRYKDEFDFTYVSPSQVIIKSVSDGSRIALRTQTGAEITKLNIYGGRHIIGHTEATMIFGDLQSRKISEVGWQRTKTDQLRIDLPEHAIIFNAGEATIVEYGLNDPVGVLNCERVGRGAFSVRSLPDNSVIVAHLLDESTVRVYDLTSKTARVTVEHSSRITWLDLSQSGTRLAFTDSDGRLHLICLDNDVHRTLLDVASFAQFVPESNVLVAQSRDSLCVWYYIGSKEGDALYTTRLKSQGSVTKVADDAHGTSVYVDDGMAVQAHSLDDTLLGFDAAVNDNDLPLAMQLLDAFSAGDMASVVDITPMWVSIAERALELKELAIAERCFVAVHDVSRARYVRKLIKVADHAAADAGKGEDGVPPTDNYEVRARLAILNNFYSEAESIYLENGQLEKALDMYQEVQQWDQAIRLAEQKNHPDAANLRQDYINWLLDTNQHEKAGAMLQENGDLLGAVDAFLKGNVPARAANVLVQNEGRVDVSPSLLQRISSALREIGLNEKAGLFYERLHMYDEAMSAYLDGQYFAPAVRLARLAFPQKVEGLEQQWASHLDSIRQYSTAVNHYIEGNMIPEALIACSKAGQFRKMLSLLPSLPVPDQANAIAKKNSELLTAVDSAAAYFVSQESLGDAEKILLAFGLARKAADLNLAAGRADRASTLIQEHLPEEAVSIMSEQADSLAKRGKLAQAEEAYLVSGRWQAVFDMYYPLHRFDDIIRAAEKPQSGVDVIEVNRTLGARLVEDNESPNLCEKYLIAGEAADEAIRMYLQARKCTDALRIAKEHGAPGDAPRVALASARILGGATPEALEFLEAHSVTKDAVRHALKIEKDFPLALSIARATPALKSYVTEIEYNQALALEDVGDFPSAAALFISCGKAQEAIDMFSHVKNYDEALRIAEAHVQGSIDDVRLAQGAYLIDQSRPDEARKVYADGGLGVPGVIALKNGGFFKHALQLAQSHAPDEVTRVQKELAAQQRADNQDAVSQLLETADHDLKRREFVQAMDGYVAAGRAGGGADAWDKAVSIATEFVKGHIPRVASEAAQAMLESGEPQRAAQLFSLAGDHDAAVNTLLQAGLIDEARDVAESKAPGLVDKVNAAHRENLVAAGNTSQLLNEGDIDTALNVYEKDSNWEGGLDALAKRKNRAATLEFALRYIKTLSDAEKVREAALVLQQRSEDIFPLEEGQASELEIIANVAGDILLGVGIDSVEQSEEAAIAILEVLRAADPAGTIGGDALRGDVARYVQVLHLVKLRATCFQQGTAGPKKKPIPDAVRRLGYKASVALVRHCDLVAVDRVFYDAGQHSRELNLNTLAFIFTNRFLDLLEAMEDADGTTVIENNDFTETDIPYDFALPYKSLITEEQKDEASEQVLTMSVDPDTAHQVPLTECESCHDERYIAGLKCTKCGDVRESCVITGWPVWTEHRGRVECESCARPANREDWNRYVEFFGCCPWCGEKQVPRF